MSAGARKVTTRRPTADSTESVVQSDRRLLWIETCVLSSFRGTTHKAQPPLDARKAFEDDDIRRDVLHFLEGSSPRCLYVYIAAGGNAGPGGSAVKMTTMPRTEMLSTKKILCLRKEIHDKLTPENIASSLAIMEISPRSIETFHELVQDVYAPMILRGATLDIPSAVKDSLENELFGLQQRAKTFASAVRGRTQLCLLPDGRTPDIYTAEKLAGEWMKLLRGILAEGDELRRSDSQSDPLFAIPPLDECRFWRWRLGNLESLENQLNSESVKQVEEVLAHAQSNYSSSFAAVKGRIINALGDTRSIVTWLAPLAQHFDSFCADSPTRTDFSALVPHSVFPIVFHLLHLLWVHNDVYGTNGRMGPLICGICESVISYSCHHLALEEYFIMDQVESNARFATVFEVCAKLKESYFVFRRKIDTANANKEWKVLNGVVFRRLDNFLERCLDLSDLQAKRSTFEWLAAAEVGGTEGNNLRCTIAEVLNDFMDKLTAFAKDSFALIDSPSAAFDERMSVLKEVVSNMQRRIASAIVEQAQLQSISIPVVRRISLLRRAFSEPSLAPFWLDCLSAIWSQWRNEIREVTKIFAESCRQDPPLGVHLPPTSRKFIMYFSALRRLFDLRSAIGMYLTPKEDEMTDGYIQGCTLCEAACHKISQCIAENFAEWSASLSGMFKLLHKTVIAPAFESDEFGVVLDPMVVAAMRDASIIGALLRKNVMLMEGKFGGPSSSSSCCPYLELPPTAIQLLQAREPLWRNYVALFKTVISFNELHSSLLPHEKRLFADQVQEFERVMQPGVESVTWDNDDEIRKFIADCNRGIGMLKSLVDKIRAVLAAPEQLLSGLSSIPDNALQIPLLVSRIGDKTLTIEEFELKSSVLAQHRASVVHRVAESLLSLREEALEMTNQLKEDVGFPRITAEHEGWKMFLSHVDSNVTNVLTTFTVDAFVAIHRQLDRPTGHAPQDSIPLLDVRVEVSNTTEEGHLTVYPDLDGTVTVQLASCVAATLQCLEPLVTVSDPQQRFVELISKNDIVSNGQLEIAKCIERTKKAVARRIESLDRFAELWHPAMEKNIVRSLESNPSEFFGLSLEEIESRYARYLELSDDALALPQTVVIDWLHLDFRALKAVLRANALKCSQMLIDHVHTRVNDTIYSAENFMTHVTNRIEVDLIESADNPTALRNVFETLRQVRHRSSVMASQLTAMTTGVRLLSRCSCVAKETLHTITDRIEQLEPSWEALNQRSLTVREQMSALQDREAERVKEEMADFNKLLSFTAAKLYSSDVFGFSVASDEAYKQLSSWHTEICSMQSTWADFVMLQDLYEMRETTCPELDVILEDLKVAKTLWDLIDLIQYEREEWMKTPFAEVDSIVMVEDSKNFMRELAALPAKSKSWTSFKGIESSLQDFAVALPLVHDLRNPAMRERHWKELMATCDAPPDMPRNPSDENFSLSDLLKIKLHKYTVEVGRLVERAEKEHGIEKNLTRIATAWEGLCVPVCTSTDLNCTILDSLDGMFEQLEDHVNVLQSISNSRWVEHFRADVVKWQRDLACVDVTMTIWMDVQKRWINLHPIFIGSDDMRTQLHDDAVAFDRADAEFVEIMYQVTPTMKAIDICTVRGMIVSESTTLLEVFEALQQTISSCEKRLAEYLELKRRIFPRFFFLSNADLVDVLSKANDPKSVLSHFGKIVPAVGKCTFAEDNKEELLGVTSIEGEELDFIAPCSCNGKVELWMHSVMCAIEQTVHSAISEASAQYVDSVRTEWALSGIIQAVCVAARVHWTLETSLALGAVEDGNSSAMHDHATHLQAQLEETIKIVLGTLSKEQRKAIVTLITIDVHCRDVVGQLIQKRIDTPSAFAWQSQLRFSFAQGAAPSNVRRCKSSICDAEFNYGGEYIGNCGCLVVTPLTDRCYLTLTQSLKLHIGGAPAGPAGTGKTETVKDLAHALGIAVYVMNCSDQMDYRSVANIFKGLAMSGSFGCFDEFNRIAVEVLSVVASQVHSVFDALRRNSPTFEILGEHLALSPSVGIFITMNPGYKGRTELPENIKSLFRPCAMVVPDFQYICEITLAAEGFVTAKALANKFVKMYQLNVQLLSPQEHYDWGLRAMRAVLMIAGTLRRKSPQLDERITLMRALQDANEAKLSTCDKPIFTRLVALMFPNFNADCVRDPQLVTAIHNAAAASGILLGEGGIVAHKVLQLFDVLQVRHSAFVIGPPGSGKSTILNLLAGATEEFTAQHVAMECINPKALSSDELYGKVHEQTREWRDGVLSRVFRDFATNSRFSKYHTWILLDGGIDPDWIESMNSVMDDNKLLTLASNERISMSPQMRLLFEITHLHNATPATVSRAGILYINEADVGWIPFKDRWIASRCERERQSMDILFDKHISTFLSYARHSVVPISTIAYIRTLCHFLHGILALDEFKAAGSNAYERVFMWCCIQAFGGAIPYAKGVADYRALFSHFVRKEFQGLKVPDQGLVFDYYLRVAEDKQEVEWVHWSTRLSEQNSEMVIPELQSETYASTIPQNIIPTASTVRFSYLLDLLVPHSVPALFVGTAGVAKSTLVKHYVRQLSIENYELLEINFSGFTDSEVFQGLMERRLERRAGRQFGPITRKKLVAVLEDINFPLPDKYSSQSALELLRQHMDRGFWLDRVKLVAKQIVDVQYITLMNHEAGSQTILDRLQDRLVTLCVGLPPHDSLVNLWSSLLGDRFSAIGVVSDISAVTNNVVIATVRLCEMMEKSFPATGMNWHYRFTMHDMHKIIEGVTHIGPRTPLSTIPRLWAHEAERVFADRLATSADWSTARQMCRNIATSTFQHVIGVDAVNNEATFIVPRCVSEGAGNSMRWKLLRDHDDVREFISTEMGELGIHTNLVFFDEAVGQIVRICRILSMPKGHCLIVGIGGCGRRSLASLAAALSGHEKLNLRSSGSTTPADFRNEMNRTLKNVALRHHKTCLVLDETQLSGERVLDNINEFLCSGTMDVFTPEESEELRAKMGIELRAMGSQNFRNTFACEAHFRSNCSANLRIVYCVSPVGPSLRRLWRMFPGFASVMSMNFFHPWPGPALQEVAERLLEINKVKFDSDDERNAVLAHCVFVQQSSEEACEVSRTRDRRTAYVTPKSFISFMSQYAHILASKRSKWETKHSRLEAGLSKLHECGCQITTLQHELKARRQEAETQAASIEILLERVGNERAIVAEQNAVALREEEKTSKIVNEVNTLVNECETDLKNAEPMILAARAALDTLDKSNLVEMKSMPNPPDDVTSVVAAVMCLTAHGRIPTDRSWNAARRLMQDITRWMKTLQEYDVNNIPQPNIDAVQQYVNSPGFTPETIRSKSFAASSLCAWVINVVKFHGVRVIVRPKEARLDEAQGRLTVSKHQLKKVRDKVAELNAKLTIVVTEYDAALASKHAIETLIEKTELKLQRAKQLVQSLAGEKIRWSEGIGLLECERGVLVADAVHTAAFVGYCGPFASKRRSELQARWLADIASRGIQHNPNVDPVLDLYDESTVATWNNESLPQGTFPSQSAAILLASPRWPILVDPQQQGLRWIQHREGAKEDMKLIRHGGKGFVPKLIECVSHGLTAVVSNIVELDKSLFTLLSLGSESSHDDGTARSVVLGETEVVVHKNFRVIAQTSLSAPTYRPEIYALASVVEFGFTEDVLVDQLLGCVVNMEKPQLEASLSEIRVKMNGMVIELQYCEDVLLAELSAASGDILENDVLVSLLVESKRRSLEVQEAFAAATETRQAIQDARNSYRPVANRGALMYFALSELHHIDPMYQYSTDAFLREFKAAIERERANPTAALRVDGFVASVTDAVFSFIDRSLLVRHRLAWKAMVAFAVMERDGSILPEHIAFVLRGGSKSGLNLRVPESVSEWITPAQWDSVSMLPDVGHSVPALSSLADELIDNGRWKVWAATERPEAERLPGDWKLLSAFHRLLIIRCLRPDRVVAALRILASDCFGSSCLENHDLPLEQLLDQCEVTTPILLVLTPGADAGKSIDDCSEHVGHSGAIVSVPMGQGQEEIAEKALETASLLGNWLVLHNVHLMPRWISTLERSVLQLIAEDSANCHPGFRLFLSSECVEHLPVGLLQASYKVVCEPPSDLKANMIRAYSLFSSEPWEQSTKPHEYHCIVLAMCFFHALVVGRSRFGAFGWNRKYPFSFEDLRSCVDVLSNHLEERPRVPWDDLRFLFGEVMYGGHITDFWDRRIIPAYLKQLVCAEAVEGVELARGVPLPVTRSFAETVAGLQSGFPEETPIIFGLSASSETRSSKLQAADLFEQLLRASPQHAFVGDAAAGAQLEQLAMLMGAVPETIQMDEIEGRLDEDPTPYQHVFVQECVRQNILSATMRINLDELEAALKGRAPMTPALQLLLDDVTNDCIPPAWEALCAPTTRSLASWTTLLAEGSAQLNAWSIDLATPKVVLLRPFFLPGALLSAVLQDASLRLGAELDKVELVTEVTRKAVHLVDVHSREGCFIYGPSLEGASWDSAGNCLQEAKMKESVPLPVLAIRGTSSTKVQDRADKYRCPLYGTSNRSSTFIAALELRTKVPPDTWVLKGVAMILDAE